MSDLERDLGRYLDALTDRVAAGEISLTPVSDLRPTTGTRRASWLATAAVVVVIATALGVVAANRDPVEPDESPVATEQDGAPVVPDPPEQGERGSTVPGLDEWGEGWRELPDVVEVQDSSARLVWTGQELVGVYPENRGLDVAAQVWDASLDEVRAASPSGVVWRVSPTVLWTGDEVLIMGGGNGPGLDPVSVSYDPIGDTWRRLASPPGIDETTNSALGQGVWTGSEVVFWSEGFAYDPAADEWRAIAPFPLADRVDPAVVATDSRVWVWGGCPTTGTDEQCASDRSAHADGAIYDPATDSWDTVADGGPTRGAEAHAVWTGREVVVVTARHGADPGGSSVAAHDPASGRWRDVDPPDGEFGSFMTVAAGDPGIVVVGGSAPAQFLARGTEQWRILGEPAPQTRGVSAAWIDDTLVLTGGGSRTFAFEPVE